MSAVDGSAGYRWLAFTPQDTVFIRDGRAFDAAAQARAQTVRPTPTTVAGATAAAFGAEPLEVCGPVLARRVHDEWVPFFPVPLDLVVETDADSPWVHRLAVESFDPARADLEMPGWLVAPQDVGAVTELTGWLSGEQLADYLAGTLLGKKGIPQRDLDVSDPVHPEPRVGLAREDDRSVKPGYLYQVTHLRPEPGWGFAVGCVLPPDWVHHPVATVPFGGRGRLADVERIDELPLPPGPGRVPGGRVLVYLATPAIWPGGWRIPLPEGARLEAAAVGEPQPVATTTAGPRWKQDRVLRWAVPAGSVYLVRFDDEERAAGWANRVHGRTYGRAVDDRIRTAGFGLVLTGVWM